MFRGENTQIQMDIRTLYQWIFQRNPSFERKSESSQQYGHGRWSKKNEFHKNIPFLNSEKSYFFLFLTIR